jgi:hypothetical protein
LQRQKLALRQQLSTVITQRNKAVAQRDTARAQLAEAQSGVAGTLNTMRPEQVWQLMAYPLANVLNTPPHFSTSHFVTTDYDA